MHRRDIFRRTESNLALKIAVSQRRYDLVVQPQQSAGLRQQGRASRSAESTGAPASLTPRVHEAQDGVERRRQGVSLHRGDEGLARGQPDPEGIHIA